MRQRPRHGAGRSAGERRTRRAGRAAIGGGTARRKPAAKHESKHDTKTDATSPAGVALAAPAGTSGTNGQAGRSAGRDGRGGAGPRRSVGQRRDGAGQGPERRGRDPGTAGRRLGPSGISRGGGRRRVRHHAGRDAGGGRCGGRGRRDGHGRPAATRRCAGRAERAPISTHAAIAARMHVLTAGATPKPAPSVPHRAAAEATHHHHHTCRSGIRWPASRPAASRLRRRRPSWRVSRPTPCRCRRAPPPMPPVSPPRRPHSPRRSWRCNAPAITPRRCGWTRPGSVSSRCIFP